MFLTEMTQKLDQMGQTDCYTELVFFETIKNKNGSFFAVDLKSSSFLKP
jgi:hypothetical protein